MSTSETAQTTDTTDVLPVIFLKSNRITMRPPCEGDAPYFTKWMNDPEVRLYLTRYLPISESDEVEWIRNLGKRSATDVTLVIVVDGKPIGVMSIGQINWKDRTGTTGAVIGNKEYWGRGYGTDAKMAVLDYAFNTLNLRKIMSRVWAFNKRSLAYSLHCGYTTEGRLRKQHFANGRFYDEILLGLFKKEWLPYWRSYRKKHL